MDNENKKETIKKETSKKEIKKEIKKEEIKKEEIKNETETSSLDEFIKKGTEILEKNLEYHLLNEGLFNGEDKRNHRIRRTKKSDFDDRMKNGIKEFKEDLEEYSIQGKIFGHHSLNIWEGTGTKKKLILSFKEEIKD